MDNKILLSSRDFKFEPHLLGHQLPFIFHTDRPTTTAVGNFHENPEILYFIRGSGAVYINGTSYPVSAGDVAVIDSFAVHQVTVQQQLEYHCLIIDSSFCRSNGINEQTLHFQPIVREKQINVLYQRVVTEYMENGPFRQTAIKSAVLELLLALCRQYSSPRTTHAHHDQRAKCMHQAMEYVKNNVGKKLTLEEMAACAGFSKYYFARAFKQYLGLTPLQYIQAVRCGYAERLLRSGKYSVKQVAVMCGFENFSYFSNVYKKYIGQLPSWHLGVPEQDMTYIYK